MIETKPNPYVAASSHEERRIAGCRRVRLANGVLFVAAVLPGTTHGQCVPAGWVQVANVNHGPGPRAAHAMAYDSARGEAVMFGGWTETAPSTTTNQTWVWRSRSRTWAQALTSSQPTAVFDSAMAFDPTCGRVVLFGGTTAAGAVLNQTWEWDGSAWVQFATPAPMRSAHEMFFDPALGKVIATAGATTGGVRLTTTYAYDCATHQWAEVANGTLSPSLWSIRPAIAYVPVAGFAVSFGGHPDCCPADPGFRPTTRFTSATQAWTAFDTAGSPSGRYACRFCWLPDMGRLLLFGGERIVGGSTNTLFDTFLLDPGAAAAWANLGPITNPASPGSGRGLYTMVYDGVLGGALLFGGRTLPNTTTSTYADTWVFSTRSIATVDPATAAACPSEDVGFAIGVAGTGPFIYEWQVQTAPNTWANLTTTPQLLPCGGAATVSATAPTASETNIAITPCPNILPPGAAQRFQVRCIVSNACGSVTSNEATYVVCPADINCMGGPSVQDIFDFLALYFATDPRADFNNSGAVSVQDIFDFLAAYFAGCS